MRSARLPTSARITDSVAFDPGHGSFSRSTNRSPNGITNTMPTRLVRKKNAKKNSAAMVGPQKHGQKKTDDQSASRRP